MSIGKKLWIGFGILFVLIALTSLTITFKLRELRNISTQIIELYEPLSSAAYELEINFLEMCTSALTFMITGSEEYLALMEESEEEYLKGKAVYDSLALTDNMKLLGRELDSMHNEFRDIFNRIVDYAARSNNYYVDSLTMPVQDDIFRLIELALRTEELIDEELQFIVETRLLNADASRQRAELHIYELALFLLAGGTAAWFITSYLTSRKIISGLQTLKAGAEAFGDGNLTHQIKLGTKDELGQLAVAFNQMAEKRALGEQALRDAKQNLEEQVLLRTHELRLSNRALTHQLAQRAKAQKQQEIRLQITASLAQADSIKEAAVNLLKVLADMSEASFALLLLFPIAGSSNLAQAKGNCPVVHTGKSCFCQDMDSCDNCPWCCFLSQRMDHVAGTLIVEYGSASRQRLEHLRDVLVRGDVPDCLHLPSDSGSLLIMPVKLTSQVIGYLYLDKEGSAGFPVDTLDFLREVSLIISHALRRLQHEEKTHYISRHDQLTGLYNRAYFDEFMQNLDPTRDYPVTLISLDVDSLKEVNDYLGHEHGDQLICDCAKIVQESVKSDSVIARIGGDEFITVMVRTTAGEAEFICNNIQTAVREHNKNNPGLCVGLSLGAAISPGPQQPLENTLREADGYMYQDKLLHKGVSRKQLVSMLLYQLESKGFLKEAHLLKMQHYSSLLLKYLPPNDCNKKNLNLLIRYYNLGMVSLPQSILDKGDALSIKEWEMIKQHPEKGSMIAKLSPEISPISGLILKHHERWDGSGYPLRIKGEAIPMECRILAIVKAYVKLTQGKGESLGLSKKLALAQIQRSAGTAFDPTLVKVFRKAIYEEAN